MEMRDVTTDGWVAPPVRRRRRWATLAAVVLAVLVSLGGAARPATAADGTPTATTSVLVDPGLPLSCDDVVLVVDVLPADAVGTVQFFDNGAPLGTPVPVVGGVAQLRTTLGAGGHTITAQFVPADPTQFLPSQSNASGLFCTDATSDTQSETIEFSIPGFPGEFVLAVSDTPVQLSDAVLSADNTTFESTGQLGSVTVNDTRFQSAPGWHVSGHVGDFGDGTTAFTGNDLGWTPQITTPNAANDVVAGPAVPPGSNPGLTRSSALASAAASKGLGMTVLGASLDLKMPSSTQSGTYSATLTITVLTAA
jgi:hypothetical protein